MNEIEYRRMYEVEDTYWWFVARRCLALRLIEKFAPDSKSALDVGCGTGAMLVELQRRMGAKGLDVSSEALEFASKRGISGLVLGDAEHLPFGDREFDMVVSLDTVEHVRDDAAAIGEFFRVLEPGGVCVVNVPAFRWLWGPHDVALHHFRRYTRRELVARFREAGFDIQFATYSVFLLFFAVVLRRILERFDRGPARVRLPAVSRLLNRGLVSLMRFESAITPPWGLPWGSSVVLVARKPR